MLHSIGRAPLESASEPLELLLKCHERIRDFVGIALRLAGSPEAPASEIISAATSLRRYFSVALPLHEEDEEQSIAPRLIESPARYEVDEALEEMASQHTAAHAL